MEYVDQVHSGSCKVAWWERAPILGGMTVLYFYIPCIRIVRFSRLSLLRVHNSTQYDRVKIRENNYLFYRPEQTITYS